MKFESLTELPEVVVSHTDEKGILQLYRMKEDGSDRQQLTRSKRGSLMPACSPDGRKRVYLQQIDQGLSLWISDVDGRIFTASLRAGVIAYCLDERTGEVNWNGRQFGTQVYQAPGSIFPPVASGNKGVITTGWWQPERHFVPNRDTGVIFRGGYDPPPDTGFSFLGKSLLDGRGIWDSLD